MARSLKYTKGKCKRDVEKCKNESLRSGQILTEGIEEMTKEGMLDGAGDGLSDGHSG